MGVAPELAAHALVQVFGERFRQSIRDGSQRVDAGNIVGQQRHGGDLHAGRFLGQALEFSLLGVGNLGQVLRQLFELERGVVYLRGRLVMHARHGGDLLAQHRRRTW